MRKFLYSSVLALVSALLMSASAAAQETPKAEVFGGYAYAGEGTHGWNTSVAGNVNRWLGVVADFSGQYTSLDEVDVREKIRTHSALFGPQVSLRRHKRVTPFARALFGASHVSTDATEFGQSFAFSDTTFALALGGGLDVRVNDRLAVRAFQADYVRTRFFGGTQNKGRLSFGLVFRFGRK